jgi:zinc protease
LHVNKVIVSLLSALLLAACEPPQPQTPAPGLPDGVTLVEAYDGAGEDFAIPYGKYRLDNGLTVILHEDHSDPLVHVDVTYHVGSAARNRGARASRISSST